MRPTDWSPVGLSSDPVPGDAVMVLAGGNDYLEVADSIDRAARRMSQLESGGMISEALDATAFGPRDALRLLRNDPAALVESAGQWLRPVLRPQVGDEVYRLHGGSSQWYGKSWSPVDPHTLHNPRSTLGMPSGGKYGTNEMTDLIVGRLDDLSHVEDVRHALPMDGFPGGAPEYVIDWSRTGAVERLHDIVMTVP